MDNRMIFYVVILLFSLSVKSAEKVIVANVSKNQQECVKFMLCNNFEHPNKYLESNFGGGVIILTLGSFRPFNKKFYNLNSCKQQQNFKTNDNYDIEFDEDNVDLFNDRLKEEYNNYLKITSVISPLREFYLTFKRQSLVKEIVSGGLNNDEIISLKLNEDTIATILELPRREDIIFWMKIKYGFFGLCIILGFLYYINAGLI